MCTVRVHTPMQRGYMAVWCGTALNTHVHAGVRVRVGRGVALNTQSGVPPASRETPPRTSTRHRHPSSPLILATRHRHSHDRQT